jgi:hypothetical protein
LRLGRLFRQRLLLLNHTGRITGKSRRTVLEVVDHDSGDDSYVVASNVAPCAGYLRRRLRADFRAAGKQLPFVRFIPRSCGPTRD